MAVFINDRRSGQPVTLRIGREGFDAIVALNLDDARLPALLVSVAAADDRVLARFLETPWNCLPDIAYSDSRLLSASSGYRARPGV